MLSLYEYVFIHAEKISNALQSVHLSTLSAISTCALRRIESLGCVVRFLPVRKRPVVELRRKAIKVCMHSRSEAKSGRLGQAAESQCEDCARIAIPYKFPADDSINFAVWQLWVRTGVPFMLEHTRRIPN